jgi:outer membrane receptor protein involved in Fe transport
VSDEEMNSFSDTAYANKILYGNEFYIYLEGHFKLNQKLLVDMGLRLSGMQSGVPAIGNAEPRVSINYLLTPDLVLKTGYSRMNQYMHLLSSAGVSMPTDIWVPALKGVKPLQSDQVNIGLTYNWNEKAFFSFEIYQKWMHHTTDLANGSSIASDMTPWFDKVVQGTGSSKGIELLVEKQFGDLKGMLSYTLSKSTRQYDLLNNGNPFRFRYDRLHDLSISLNFQISKHWDVSALWVLGSGYPVTLPVSKYSAGIIIHNNDSEMGGVVYDYPSKNNYTLHVYHRLDLGVHYNNTNRWWQYTWSIDIFNAYNRKNPVYLYYSNNYPMSFKYGSFLPMIPTISYLLKF